MFNTFEICFGTPWDSPLFASAQLAMIISPGVVPAVQVRQNGAVWMGKSSGNYDKPR